MKQAESSSGSLCYGEPDFYPGNRSGPLTNGTRVWWLGQAILGGYCRARRAQIGRYDPGPGQLHSAYLSEHLTAASEERLPLHDAGTP